MTMTKVVLSAIFIAVAGVAALKIKSVSAAAEHSQSVALAKAALLDIRVRIKDGQQIVAFGSNASRAAEVPRLQQLARDTIALQVPACLGATKQTLVEATTLLSSTWVTYTIDQIRFVDAFEKTLPVLDVYRNLPGALATVCL